MKYYITFECLTRICAVRIGRFNTIFVRSSGLALAKLRSVRKPARTNCKARPCKL